MGCVVSRLRKPAVERLVKTAGRTDAATSTDGTSAEGSVHAAPLHADTAVEVRARISGDDGSLFGFLGSLTGSPWFTAMQFEQLTPMLVMPFHQFKKQGRIVKSTQVWRDQALATGSLVVHDEGSSKVVIFISHTWWDRGSSYDKDNKHGAPDYQAGEKKDLKWRVICAGVRTLVQEHGLEEEDVSLWVDWQSIYQDDMGEKLNGVKSLIKFISLCRYMFVPTEEGKLKGTAAFFPEEIPSYGTRAWCRIEYFVFSRLAEMRGHEVQLYAILLDGTLNCYPEVSVEAGKDFMPSNGAVSDPDDIELVLGLENKMIEAFGKLLVELNCKAAGYGGHVDLEGKMIRHAHLSALFAAVERYNITSLDLSRNQLERAGMQAGQQFSSFSFSLNTSITSLNLGWNGLGPKGIARFAQVLKGNTTLTSLNLDGNMPCGVYKEFDEDIQNLVEMGTYTSRGFTQLCEVLTGSAKAQLPAKSSALKLRQEDLRGGNNSVTAEEAQLPAPAASRLGPCCQAGS